MSIDNCQLSIVNQPLETRLQELLRRNDPLLRTLQTLHEDRDVLTRPQLEKICAYYQVSPAKLAKLASFFPESAIALESATIVDNHLSENASETQTEIQGSDVAEDVSSLFGYPSTSVSECLQYLAEQDKLSQDRYVRYLAARVRMPTCRLSKLRSYYRWNHEQID